MTTLEFLRTQIPQGLYSRVESEIEKLMTDFAIEQLRDVGKKMMENLDSDKSKASFFDDKIKELKSEK